MAGHAAQCATDGRTRQCSHRARDRAQNRPRYRTTSSAYASGQIVRAKVIALFWIRHFSHAARRHRASDGTNACTNH